MLHTVPMLLFLALLVACPSEAGAADKKAADAGTPSPHEEAAARFYVLSGTDALLASYYDSPAIIAEIAWLQNNPALVPVYLKWARDHQIYGGEEDAISFLTQSLALAELKLINAYYASPAGVAYTQAQSELLQQGHSGKQPGWFQSLLMILKHRWQHPPDQGEYFFFTPVGQKSQDALAALLQAMSALSSRRIAENSEDLVARIRMADPRSPAAANAADDVPSPGAGNHGLPVYQP